MRRATIEMKAHYETKKVYAETEFLESFDANYRDEERDTVLIA